MNLLKSLLAVFMLAASLMADAAQSAFAPFPKARDSYWRKRVPQVMRRDYIRLGEEYVSTPWRKIPDTVFAEFRTTGNRTNYEDSCFSRRRQLACLVMAEIMEHRGRFMPDICRGLHYFLEQEPWWGIPAHYPKSAPDAAVQTVDLFNAETSSMLAWTIYMLGTEIDSRESGLAERVRSDIARRFLMPTLTEKQGWMNNANNWNTWITSNFLEAALVCLPSDSRRYELANNRSLYHNVPLVGGVEQHAGAQYHASGVSHTASDSASVFTLDIAGAYPKEARLASWQRTLRLNRKLNRVEVKEGFADCAAAGGGASEATNCRQEVQITLMCYGCPVMKKQGRVALAESGAVLGYDAATVDVSWQKVASSTTRTPTIGMAKAAQKTASPTVRSA